MTLPTVDPALVEAAKNLIQEISRYLSAQRLVVNRGSKLEVSVTANVLNLKMEVQVLLDGQIQHVFPHVTNLTQFRHRWAAEAHAWTSLLDSEPTPMVDIC